MRTKEQGLRLLFFVCLRQLGGPLLAKAFESFKHPVVENYLAQISAPLWWFIASECAFSAPK